jgi:glycosyltransferase involved in cell wall biosynthesis
METVGIGGSETCAAKLANHFPSDYEIYVSGNVAEETHHNVRYVPFKDLEHLVRTNDFYAVIISRYIGFLDDYSFFSSYKLFIWIHDLCFVTFKFVGHAHPPDVLQKWLSRINNIICLSEWHREHFQGLYPIVSDKIIIIPNGITSSTFKPDTVKKKNRFIFTSCPERGYAKLFELWPEITRRIPDAELKLATYTGFPRNDEENEQMNWIQRTSNIEFVGCLKPSELYSLMGSAEYWLYPTDFCETFCITALEMLHNKVLCLYYPVAALQNTVGDYGIRITKGSEIESIMNIVHDTTKENIKEKGLQYARTFDWTNVFTKWSDLIFKDSNPRTLLRQAQVATDDHAIGMLKNILTLDNCKEEQYVSCLKLFLLYKKVNIERGLVYLAESSKYNTGRVECAYHLIQHFVCQEKWNIAYQHYQRIQSYYEQYQWDTNTIEFDTLIYEFSLPYIMIPVSEQTKNYATGIFMYELIFRKKSKGVDTNYIHNLIFNFQFFISHIPKGKTEFIDLFIEYVNNLNCLQSPKYIGMITRYITELDETRKNDIHLLQYNTEKCKNSRKILFWCGFPVKPWNYSTYIEKGLGGAETCVVQLARHLPEDCEIYVCGGVAEEKVRNVSYVGIDKLLDLLENNFFHTIIVSRFIGFFEDYPYFSTYKLFVWIHDLEFIPFKNVGIISFYDVLNKWNSRIDNFICLTEWHRTHMIAKYPFIADKTIIIPNGICSSYFSTSVKRKNRFIFTSAPERGYAKLFELWPAITNLLPDAELKIATYTGFPRNCEEKEQMNIIQQTPNMEFVGCLHPTELYSLMGSSEYWLYPTDFCETFCITALEMLHNKVLCLYYPVAALNNTLGDYGIRITKGSEIDTLRKLVNDDTKHHIMEKGLHYARTFDWSKVVTIWTTLLDL